MLKPARSLGPLATVSDAKFQRHVITCEFPPQEGGVSDYTYSVVKELAARGENIHVWCPKSEDSYLELPGVTVHRDLGDISPADLRRVGKKMNGFASPRKILLQWVPHGYRYKSLNLLFCLWILQRAIIRRDQIEIMTHEAFLWFGEGSWKITVAAIVHRIMISCLLAAASKVWLATSAWGPILKPYCLGRKIPFQPLPIPSNIPVCSSPVKVASIRSHYATGENFLLGHFGTYGRTISDTLSKIIKLVLESNDHVTFVLIGRGSDHFRSTLINSYPSLAGRIFATGPMDPSNVSHHIQCCDLMIQPYPDGIATRRGSAMACLAHGCPIVTTRGHLTEAFWELSDALAIEPAGSTEALARRISYLISDNSERTRLGHAARSLYANWFSLSRTVDALRTQADPTLQSAKSENA